MSSASPPSPADIVADSIELVVPLQARYLSTVRVVTAAAAAELGFTVDEIDDLRLGVDEAVSLFGIADDGGAGDVETSRNLRIEIRLGVDGLRVILIALTGGERQRPDAVDVLGKKVLAAVVDGFELHADCVELFKRRPAG